MTIKNESASKWMEKEFGKLTFGEYLNSICEADEIDQIELAKKLKMSPQSLNDLIKGRRIPSPERAANIAEILGYNEAYFIQLALNDSLNKSGFDYKVKITAG